MKTTFGKYFALITTLLVITGCQNLFEPPKPVKKAAGTGYFSLVIDGQNAKRTIIPATVKTDYAVYTLEFFTAGTTANPVVTEDRFSDNPSEPVLLNAGTWDLRVTAYTDTEKTIPAATGILPGIVINANETIADSVEIMAILGDGTGTFIWNIDFPDNVISANMTITPLNTATGTPELSLLFTGETPIVGKEDSCSLNTGYYRVVFKLMNNTGLTTEQWQILHIYPDMESAFACTFTEEQFSNVTIFVTNNADSGAGSLRQAITTAPPGSTIVVQNGIGTIAVKMPLRVIYNDLNIEGNGVTIIQDTEWEDNDNVTSNPLLVISGVADKTVTIRRVHFKDAKVPSNNSWGTYHGAIYNMHNLNLESCIFSGNQSNGYGGAINNDGTMSVKSCTFYGNRTTNSTTGFGGAICNINGTLTLEGNLFYENTANTYPVVYALGGTVISNGYNVVDVSVANWQASSGWDAATGDKTINSLPISPTTFNLLSNSGAANVITTLPNDYPTVDFYGNPIKNGAAAGAVQVSFALLCIVDDFTDDNNSANRPGTLRHALATAKAERGDTIIRLSGVTPGKTTIYLTGRLDDLTGTASEYKNIAIERNGVTITRDTSWTAVGTDSQLLNINHFRLTVNISRVHFKDNTTAYNGGAIYIHNGSLSLESCIFSGNRTSYPSHPYIDDAHGGAIFNEGGSLNNLTVKGCTFYGNYAQRYGGAIYNSTGIVSLQGNLFYGNTTGTSLYWVVYSAGSSGYNVVDLPLGSGNQTSGLNAATDKYVNIVPVSGKTFMLYPESEAANVITTLPAGYPTVDFYGNPITDGAAAGAVQSAGPYEYTITFNSNGGSAVSPITFVTIGDTIDEPAEPTKAGTAANIFKGWYDQSLTTEFNFDTPITADITLYAKWDFLYALGDTGPGGGKIFYRSEAGFIMTDNSERCYYLEAALDDAGTDLAWVSTTYVNTDENRINTNGDAIGTGRNNTNLILAKDANAPAAKACREYSNNGLDDWFLPSSGELRELYDRDTIISLGMTQYPPVYYWSSTRYWEVPTSFDVKALNFYPISGGLFDTLSNTTECGVRPIRAF